MYPHCLDLGHTAPSSCHSPNYHGDDNEAINQSHHPHAGSTSDPITSVVDLADTGQTTDQSTSSSVAFATASRIQAHPYHRWDDRMEDLSYSREAPREMPCENPASDLKGDI